jgi:two-component system sensor histidine kinase CpxA
MLWFVLNVLVLLVALWLTLRIEFGPQYRGFLPDSAHGQTQAMAEVLIDDLGKTPKDHWDDVLQRLGTAYHMEFGLFDGRAVQIAGSSMVLPGEARSIVLMTSGNRPPPDRPEPGEGAPPDRPPGPPGAPPPLRQPHQLLPDFPQRVIRTSSPETLWLLVHLPMDRLHIPGLEPEMLVGRTQKPDETPLLFNPRPWTNLAIAMVIFSGVFWMILTRNLTNSIGRMTRATEAIAEGRFDLQAPEKRDDELGRLGLAINRMAARLKGFITGQRRFLGDVAHELCSPLARMEIALGILEARSDVEYASQIRDVQEEVAHMRKLAHELLSFSKASLGESVVKLEPISVADAISNAIQMERCEAAQVNVQVPAELRVRAHPELLVRALANLLRNAVRYAGSSGPVDIYAHEENGETVIAVADQGPGVPEPELERLFDPFYRVDASRDAMTGGMGLGLAIVKTCVEACHGIVVAFNRKPSGLEVQFRFPTTAAQAA